MTALAQTAPYKLALFTADEFGRMIDADLFADKHVELRDGVLIEMSPEHVPHAGLKSELGFELNGQLRRLGRHDLRVIIDVSLRTGERSVPTPDIVVARREEAARLLGYESAVLVVEVANSSLPDDLGWKAAQYAAARVAEYWVVDMRANATHRHSQPMDGEYARIDIIRFEELLRSVSLPELEVRMSSLPA